MVFDWKNEEHLRRVCETSTSQSEVLQRLGFNRSGSAHLTLKKYCSEYGIEVPNGNAAPTRPTRTIYETDAILVKDSPHKTSVAKRRILRENLIEYECLMCGNDGNWNGGQITLQLDHINGDPIDHRLENLRFLCPNCHSQTETWGRKNRIPLVV